jgi:hypothetical protein
MIEKIILDYLNETLTVPAYMEVPEKAPESYVVIEKTGSSEYNHIKEATLAIQSIAPTLYKAACLNEEVKTVMDNADKLADITKSKCNSDYNFTDTSTKSYRYQAVYDISHY